MALEPGSREAGANRTSRGGRFPCSGSTVGEGEYENQVHVGGGGGQESQGKSLRFQTLSSGVVKGLGRV